MEMHEVAFLTYIRMDFITKETYKEKWCRSNSR